MHSFRLLSLENLAIAVFIVACNQVSRLLGYEGNGISLFWPSTALALVFGLRRGWGTVPASSIALGVWGLIEGHGIWVAIGSSLGFGLTTVAGLLALERLHRRQPDMGLTRSLGLLMMVGVLLTSPLAATVGTALLKSTTLTSANLVEFWAGYWIVEAVSAAMFVPALMHNIRPAPERAHLYPTPLSKARMAHVDMTSIAIALCVTALTLYLALDGNGTWAKLMLAVSLPVCFLISLPTSLQGSSVVMMISAGAALTVQAKLTGQQLTAETQAETFRMVLLVFEGLLISHFGWTVVAERERQAAKLKHIANQSESSGLPNRRAVSQALATLTLKSRPATLIEVQIRDLFRWADIGGHDTIARIEKLMGERITAAFAEGTDIVGHIGTGRYFICAHSPMSTQDLAEKLGETFEQAQFMVAGRNISIRCAAGIIDVPELLRLPVDQLLSASALATQESVQSGVSPLRRDFNQQHNEEHREALERIEIVQRALADGRLHLVAQPIVASPRPHTDTSQEKLTYEVLCRMIDEEGQVQPPSWFLPSIARGRLNKEFDRAVIQKALTYLSRDQGLLKATKKCSINVTGHTLCDPGFAAFVREVLRMTGIPAKIVVLEVTESDSISDFSIAQAQLRSLESFGVGCAVDDFGVGLATFDYLKKLRPQWIKIDGSFVSSIGKADADPVDREIILAAVRAARALGAQTIAEFVQTQEQIDVLAGLGVDYLQGYLIGKPIDLSQMSAFRPAAFWERAESEAVV